MKYVVVLRRIIYVLSDILVGSITRREIGPDDVRVPGAIPLVIPPRNPIQKKNQKMKVGSPIRTVYLYSGTRSCQAPVFKYAAGSRSYPHPNG